MNAVKGDPAFADITRWRRALLLLGVLGGALGGCGAGGAGAPALDAAAPAPVDGATAPDAAALPLADAAARPDAAPELPARPFGTHGGYQTAGVRFPSGPGRSASQLDDATASFYLAWKQRYLVAGCASGQYRIKTSPATATYTVSEGHGYGMLVLALMAGREPDARRIFDGLYAYYDAHRSSGNRELMGWAQNQACEPVDGSDSATDGDLDIAYALLLADRQWGSAGPVDYRDAARRMMTAIMAAEVHPQNTVLLGDWVTSNEPHYAGTRPSDFMFGHFQAFARVSAQGRWTQVINKAYAIIAYLQDNSAMTTGLLPDFAVGAPGAMPAPAPARWLEGAYDGKYGYNACRTPWRIATDYLMNGEPRARSAVQRMTAWVRSATGDDPALIRDGYHLDGSAFGAGPDPAFVAPFAVAAMVEPATGSNQPWLDALWDRLASTAPAGYYGDSIKLLAMITLSGNWFQP